MNDMPDIDGRPLFDHLAKVSGQTVNCRSAMFLATGGVPAQAFDRMALGFHIGFGLVGGGTCAAGVISLLSKALKALFS